MLALLIVFVICLVLMWVCSWTDDDAGFLIATVAAVLFGMLLAIGAILSWMGVAGVSW